ncbi:MAG: class I SAM-dependent methyltransferase [Dokdonella sp.]
MKLPTNQADDSQTSAESQLRADWTARQKTFGNVPQAVLLKNLPTSINDLIDTWHRVVLQWSLSPLSNNPSALIADLGCGYGRMTTTVKAMGFENIIGLDYEAGFCRQYQLDHGMAVRGTIAHPPFVDSSLAGAYAITAFMYVGANGATEGLSELDASLLPGARVLLMEAGAEFNNAVRKILPGKRSQSLAVTGFTRSEMQDLLLPRGWNTVASGNNFWTTMLLPLLLASRRWSRLFNALSGLAMHLDRPRPGLRDRRAKQLSLHRWILCEKPVSDPPIRHPSAVISTVAICNQETPNKRPG